MARKNQTYAEKHGSEIRSGEMAATVEREPENELDKPEVQSAILRPEKVEIPLDGGSIELPTQLTLGSLLEKRTMAVIEALRAVILKSVSDLSGDVEDEGWFARNSQYIPLVVYKEPVVNVVADFIGMLAKKPASEFKEKVNAGTVASAFILALRIIKNINDKNAGDSDQKKL